MRDEMAFFDRSSPSERRSRVASTQFVAGLDHNRHAFLRLKRSAVIILGQPPRCVTNPKNVMEIEGRLA
jgi:hypothetical protein